MKRKFQNSDIPYKDRLLMRKYQDVAQHRDEAAKIALHVACVENSDGEIFPTKKLEEQGKV